MVGAGHQNQGLASFVLLHETTCDGPQQRLRAISVFLVLLWGLWAQNLLKLAELGEFLVGFTR